ncbi:DExH-box ATP-dependent RNA helicase DExH7 [Nymphaea thermarum]|nr:DExH-box ATP-dependent RNA helicase DExH7 [Nymphaea thermarum]
MKEERATSGPSCAWRSVLCQFGSKSRELLKGRKNAQLSSWGDETILAESYINPHYHENLYEAYSERTRQNLKNLNEDVVDFDVLEELVYHIDEDYPDGAILIFLPGLTEINMLFDKLAASYHFGGLSSDWIFPLHSTLSSTDQQRVFLCPPDGIRKVIIATDIAETSITIDDVVYVVDCGKHKEMRFNPKRKMSNMVEEWISQASAKQRSGRAGRVKPGVCFCLYTRYRFEECMRKFQVPEILRMSLVELCLQIKSLSLGDIKMFLGKAMEPPHEAAVSSAIAIATAASSLASRRRLSDSSRLLTTDHRPALFIRTVHLALFIDRPTLHRSSLFTDHCSPACRPTPDASPLIVASSNVDASACAAARRRRLSFRPPPPVLPPRLPTLLPQPSSPLPQPASLDASVSAVVALSSDGLFLVAVSLVLRLSDRAVSACTVSASRRQSACLDAASPPVSASLQRGSLFLAASQIHGSLRLLCMLLFFSESSAVVAFGISFFVSLFLISVVSVVSAA